MSVLIDTLGIVGGLSLIVILFTVGNQIKATLGDSIYNVFVFIAIISGLYSASAFFSLLTELFGSTWVFNLGQYGSLSLIFIILIAKLLNWF